MRGTTHIGRRTAATLVLAACLCTLVLSAARPPAARADSHVSLLRERLYLLSGYLERYANENYSYYPLASLVHAGGITAAVWPANPWTGGAMHAGTGSGDYTYSPSGNRLSYRLTGHYPGGRVVIRVSVPDNRKMQNDHRTIESGELVQAFIERYVRAHHGTPPPAAEVSVDGAVGKGSGAYWWPHNPWNHVPLHQGRGWSDFTYSLDASSSSYTLTVHFSRGGTHTFRGPLSVTTAGPGSAASASAAPASAAGAGMAVPASGLLVPVRLGLFSVIAASIH